MGTPWFVDERMCDQIGLSYKVAVFPQWGIDGNHDGCWGYGPAYGALLLKASKHDRWVLMDQVQQGKAFGMVSVQTTIEFHDGSSLLKSLSQIGIEAIN
jgi:hypothetical protein